MYNTWVFKAIFATMMAFKTNRYIFSTWVRTGHVIHKFLTATNRKKLLNF
jgi:hypothetical protein